MDDNSADEEIKDENLSPQQGGKKLKLNDGSSQDSLKDLGSSSKDEKDENVDSGISADKSESTSSDDRAVEATSWADGPSNEVVHAAPSSSNVRAILLQIKRPKKGNRNYRKRKNTPDKEHDSDTSVQDSDDLTDEEETTSQTNEERRNSDEDNRSMDETTSVPSNMFAESDDESLSSDSISSTSNHNSDDSNESFDSSDLVRLQNIDSDSDEAPTEQDENQTPPSVLLKTRPKHNWFIVQELMKRELGLTFPCGKAAKNDVIFEHKYYGSLHAVYRLELMYKLNKHRGCVNSINFNPEGYLLASGSDDTNVIVWDWATDTALQSIKTGHKSNVFQSKFLYLNARSQLNIVTCARDGQVRLLQCPPSGGAAVSRRRLISHSKAAHKLYVSPSEPHLVISAGEDGLVMQADVRTDRPNRVFWVKDKGSTIPLYSVHGHPLEPRELAVAGRDRFVRIYDRRKSNKPINMYCPSFFHETVAKKKWAMPSLYITCAIYNHDGSEILASYSDDDIYLFDVKNDCHEPSSSKDGFTHRYSGHRNSATFKGVAFFGPRSQFVVSGSDCSNIYVWDKHSEAIVQWMCGDEGGVVNCIESHPRCPVLATSGLDKDVKIWVPSKETDPEYKGLERVVKENASSQLHSPLFNDFLPSLYSAWRGENRLFSDDDGAPPAYGGIEFDGNVCTTF